LKSDRTIIKKILVSIGVLLVAGILLLFGFSPTSLVHSREAATAYSEYLQTPTEQNKSKYEALVRKANRPVHIAQFASITAGVLLIVVLVRILDHRANLANGTRKRRLI
jgi:hypothetical protein